MSFGTVASTVVVLAILVGLIAFLAFLKKKGKSFTFRVFTALGLGVVFGAGIQLVLGLGTDATKTALDWMSIVGQGYINLLKMLVMPLVFVAIVGAFTRAEVTDNLGKIGAVVLVVLLATVAIAAIVGWAVIAFSGLAGASFADGTVDPTKLATLQDKQETVAALTIPQELLSFIPTNVFADFTGSRSTSTIAVVIFSAIVGVAYLKLRDKDSEQAEFFKKFIDALYGIVMRIVNIALITVFIVHLIIVAANRVSPITYVKKAFPVLSFAFVSRTSAGALPMNIETQRHALGVDSATANFAASFGMSIGQNGCAGIYPAMLATIIAPTVGINVFSPEFVVMLVAVIVVSSFGIAGVGGGATFASLIVLGTLGLPIEIVGILASVEPLIDMGRTALNVSDSMVAGITSSHVNGGFSREVFNNPEAQVSTAGDIEV